MPEENVSEIVKHDDLVESPSRSAPSTNPFASGSSIALSVPETVEVKLVDASVLADYEVWSLMTSIVCSAVVGFFVAFLQEKTPEISKIFAIISVVFVVLALISGCMAFYKRRALTKNSKRVQFSVGEQIDLSKS